MDSVLKLNILVIHGFAQSAATVSRHTEPLQAALSDIAELHYPEGAPLRGTTTPSRPWWILDSYSGYRETAAERWNDTVKWWSDQFSERQYDGIIGLSQGAAMTALLVSMLENPERVPGFVPKKSQSIKFAILCSGFVSNYPPHKEIYSIPSDLPTLHTLDENDGIISPEQTIELQSLFKSSTLLRHNEYHSIPVRGSWPQIFRKFIADAVRASNN